jgi:hypothetical protein
MEVEFSEKKNNSQQQEIITDLVLNINEFKRPERLNCSLCMNIFIDPKKCQSCLTHFCNQCISSWLDKNKTCPNCRAETSIRSLEKCERTLREDLEDLKFKCINHERGCEETNIKYDFFLKHCYQDCSLSIVICEFCNKEMIRKEYSEHLKSCELRRLLCAGCDKLFKVDDHEQHEQDCMKKMIKFLKTEMMELEKLRVAKKSLYFSRNILFTNHLIQVSQDKSKISIPKKVPTQVTPVALLKPRLGLKFTESRFRIKIVSLGCWIGLGIGDPLILAQEHLTLSDFQIENMQHGCYMISNNGIKWSCHIVSENYKKGIHFSQNDIIQITYYRTDNLQRVHFINENSKEETSLNVQAAQSIEKGYFDRLRAVILIGDNSDCVEILSSSFKLSK